VLQGCTFGTLGTDKICEGVKDVSYVGSDVAPDTDSLMAVIDVSQCRYS
jgi:hypothetical protein